MFEWQFKMAAIEVSGSQGGQKAQADGGGEGNGIPGGGRPGRERCTDDPNFAVMVAFLQVRVMYMLSNLI